MRKFSFAVIVMLAACGHPSRGASSSVSPALDESPPLVRHAGPPPPPATDRVSAVAEAGIAVPQGFDWPRETAEKPASQVFENATLMGNLSAERFMVAMQSRRGALGVECDHHRCALGIRRRWLLRRR
jgi:hypothetical protein